MFRVCQVSLVVIVFCLTVELNRAVTFADELGADGYVITDLELFDPSEETRFIGRPFLRAKVTFSL